MNVNSSMFSGLLFNMAGQYFKNGWAFCTKGDDFAHQLSKDAIKFFSIAVIRCDELDDLDIMGVLTDDLVSGNGTHTYTLNIYINYRRFQGVMPKMNLMVIFAHEVCHFAFFYELFECLGGGQGSGIHAKFGEALSGTLEGVKPLKKSKTNPLPADRHTFPEPSKLIAEFSKFPKEHFAQSYPTEIDYRSFFHSFLDHLGVRFSKDER